MIYRAEINKNEHAYRLIGGKTTLCAPAKNQHAPLYTTPHQTQFRIENKSFEVYCYAINLSEMFRVCKHICISFPLAGLDFFRFKHFYFTMIGENID